MDDRIDSSAPVAKPITGPAVIATVVALGVLIGTVALFTRLSPSEKRARQIESLSASFTPPEESGAGGKLETRLIYSFRNKGPDPVIRIKADLEIFQGARLIGTQRRFLVWSAGSSENALRAGSEFKSQSAVFSHIKGMDRIVVHPTQAWSSEAEYEQELQGTGYR